MPQHSLCFLILNFCGRCCLNNPNLLQWNQTTNTTWISTTTCPCHSGVKQENLPTVDFKDIYFENKHFVRLFPSPEKNPKRLHNWEKQEVNPRTLLWLQANTNNSPHQKYVSTNNIHIPPGIKTQSAWKASGLRDKKEAAQHVQGCLGWSISPNTKPAPQPQRYFGVRSARVSHKLLPFFIFLNFFFFPWQGI